MMPVIFPPGRLGGDNPFLTGSVPVTKTIGMVVVADLAARTSLPPWRWRPPGGGPDRPPIREVDQIAFAQRYSIRQVSALDIAGFAQPLAEGPSDGQLARLHQRRESRPPASPAAARAPRAASRRRAADKRDELAPPHSITSSASASSFSGIVMPRVFAVLRLMTSSNFVGC